MTVGGDAFSPVAADAALPDGRCDTVLEFGCNDTTLLQSLADVANKRIGVDPVPHTKDIPADIVALASHIEAVPAPVHRRP